MELRTEAVVATLEMSELKSREDDPSDSSEYESLPSHASLTTHMTAGAVAGILEHTVMYPIDSVKVRHRSMFAIHYQLSHWVDNQQRNDTFINNAS